MGWVMHEEREEIPSGTPQWCADLIKACWSHKPAERPDISEIIQRLEAGFIEEKAKALTTTASAEPSAIPCYLVNHPLANVPGYLSGIHGECLSMNSNDSSNAVFSVDGTNSATSGRVSDLGIFGAHVSQAVNIPHSDEEADNSFRLS